MLTSLDVSFITGTLVVEAHPWEGTVVLADVGVTGLGLEDATSHSPSAVGVSVWKFE